ncbi:autocrine proliferation repressor protein A-like [Apostichopus japonicus]|uniref:autocrine proliferation repressor protein A-like n=1 Tax=Stichopus japonicus TaxID=307972 RepID=UPI003AB4D068
MATAANGARRSRLIHLMTIVTVAFLTTTIAVVLTVVILRNNILNVQSGGMQNVADSSTTMPAGGRPTLESLSTTAPSTSSSDESGGIDYNQVLRNYCEEADSNYSYTLLPEYTLQGLAKNVTTFVLNMTSQAWSHPDAVGERHIWWHYLAITIPNDIVYEDAALVFITDGVNTDSPPDPSSDTDILSAIQLAEGLGMVVATLFQVPNQPIRFTSDSSGRDRVEDAIIAYTMREFYTKAPDQPRLLLQVPMTKSVVRAMDTVSSFASSKINRFYLTGLSKRGWAAWLTAAVDDRVVGVMPQVFDLLSIKENMRHYYRSLQGWTFALADYYRENLTANLDEPLLELAVEVIDPIEYKDELLMPKYIILSGNDEFFLPDNTHYFLNELKGVTFVRFHPNVGHNNAQRRTFILQEIQGFVTNVEENWSFPEISWSRSSNETHGEINMETDQTPLKVTAYKALTTNNEGRRDFRLHVLSVQRPVPSFVMYEEINVTQSNNMFVAVTETPDSGWACFFIEAEYEAAKGRVLRVTSEVNIIPDIFPFESCMGQDCHGTLV